MGANYKEYVIVEYSNRDLWSTTTGYIPPRTGALTLTDVTMPATLDFIP